jgi:hypothetical protein
LVQITRQLAALCIQTHQQKAGSSIQVVTVAVLTAWLERMEILIRTSPTSPLAASVRQQLQRSGLLQHMSAVLTDATDSLTAAEAAAVGEAACSNGSSSSSSTRIVDIAVKSFAASLNHATGLLELFHQACLRMDPPTITSFSMEAALPAAPAAVRLILTTFQTHSRLQQLAGRDGTPIRLLAQPAWHDALVANPSPLTILHSALVGLALGIGAYCTDGHSLHLLPGARELLLCPELVPCLAITVLSAALGIQKGALETTTAGGDGNSVRSTPSRTQDDGRRRESSQVQGSSQQQQQRRHVAASVTAANSSAGCHQAGSSSFVSRAGSSGRLANGISMDSLTPLSLGLFGLLGVNQAVLLQAASVRGGAVTSRADLLHPPGLPPHDLSNHISTYQSVLEEQVS